MRQNGPGILSCLNTSEKPEALEEPVVGSGGDGTLRSESLLSRAGRLYAQLSAGGPAWEAVTSQQGAGLAFPRQPVTGAAPTAAVVDKVISMSSSNFPRMHVCWCYKGRQGPSQNAEAQPVFCKQ